MLDGDVTRGWTHVASPRAASAPRRARRLSFRAWTVLLPALVVFAAEVVRHEVLHHEVPEMLGNVLTGTSALIISAVILLPIYRRLEAADAQIRATQVSQAVLQERERLARDLHDGVAQALFFLNVKATALERSLTPAGRGDALSLSIATEITQAVQETSERVREAIFDLRTGPEPGESFDVWVRDYTQRFAELHGLAARVEEHGAARDLPFEHQLHVMAIMREALHNVAKHARAQTVAIGVDWGGAGVTITASDDGRGLADPVPGPDQGRYGLTALSEHARAVGGTVTVGPGRDGIGTAVIFRMPHAGATSRLAPRS